MQAEVTGLGSNGVKIFRGVFLVLQDVRRSCSAAQTLRFRSQPKSLGPDFASGWLLVGPRSVRQAHNGEHEEDARPRLARTKQLGGPRFAWLLRVWEVMSQPEKDSKTRLVWDCHICCLGSSCRHILLYMAVSPKVNQGSSGLDPWPIASIAILLSVPLFMFELSFSTSATYEVRLGQAPCQFSG